MCFKEILQRYHIAPLKYDDGVELEERDYVNLFTILSKYFTIKQKVEGCNLPVIKEHLIAKVESAIKNSLVPFEPEELMDILMEQTTKEVL